MCTIFFIAYLSLRLGLQRPLIAVWESDAWLLPSLPSSREVLRPALRTKVDEDLVVTGNLTLQLPRPAFATTAAGVAIGTAHTRHSTVLNRYQPRASRVVRIGIRSGEVDRSGDVWSATEENRRRYGGSEGGGGCTPGKLVKDLRGAVLKDPGRARRAGKDGESK